MPIEVTVLPQPLWNVELIKEELLGFEEKDFGNGLRLRVGTESEEVTNRRTGAKVLLAPEAIALYEFIIGVEFGQYLGRKIDKGVEEWLGHAKDIFLERWPDAYWKLID